LKSPYLIMENNSSKEGVFLEVVIEVISMDSSLQEWIVCVAHYRIGTIKSISVVFVKRGI